MGRMPNEPIGPSLDEVARLHHEWVESMGWHNKTPLEYLALLTEEVGEAVKECRGAEPTPLLGAELADVILRTLDLMVEQGISPSQAVSDKIAENQIKGKRGRLK